MKNITLAIDETVLADARIYAAKQKTTVNALVRDYLTGLADQETQLAETRQRLAKLIKSSTAELGPDYVWNREELYEERMFPRHERPDLRGGRKKA